MTKKEQVSALQTEKSEDKAVLDKKSQPVVAKAKKAQASSSPAKKRRFTFFGDIVGELRKVVWPTRQEATRLTLIVIGLCVVMGLVLGAVDYGFSELVAKVFLGGK